MVAALPIHATGRKTGGCLAPMRRALVPTLAVLACVGFGVGSWACAEDAGAGVAETAKPSPAAALVAEAAAARADGRFAEAKDLYLRALIADPASAEAQRGLAETDALAIGAPGTGTPVAADSVQAQLAAVDARAAIERAELLVRSGRPQQARQQLERAQALLKPVIGDDATAAEIARVAALVTEAERAADAQAAGTAGAARTDAVGDAGVVRATERVHGANAFDERLSRIAALKERELYEAALDAARELALDYPGEPRAEAAFNDLLTKVHDQRAADTVEQRRFLLEQVHERIHRSLIPDGFDAKPIYPSDWTDRTAERGLSSPEGEQPEWYRRIADRLGQRLSFRFEDTPISEALRFLADQGGINVILDPQLVAEGDRQITLAADGMRLDSALSWMARLAGTTWTISKQAVYVGPEPDRDTVLQVYDVAHLVFQPADQPGKELSFANAGGAKGGSGFNLFADAGDAAQAIAPEDFVDLLQSAVSPDAWKTEGNAIDLRGTDLYVTAPRNVHALIREFIRNESISRHVVVHVQARWLTINDGFLEEIGVEWGRADALLSPNSGPASPGILTPTNGGNYLIDGSATHRLPANSIPIQPSAVNAPGLSLSVLRLGGTQLSAMLTAIETKQMGRILAAPSVSTMNAVRGSMFVGDQVAYIHDYTVVNDTLDPQIEVLNVGASLDVKPFVSADGKYVTMEFRPALATYQVFTDFIIAPTQTGVITANGNPLLAAFPIELPNVSLQTVGTTITVPDRGTLLVGGWGRIIDQQASNKIPVLGHIPFLGRLFGKRGRYSDRSKLYLLATVNIINYDEAEASL